MGRSWDLVAEIFFFVGRNLLPDGTRWCENLLVEIYVSFWTTVIRFVLQNGDKAIWMEGNSIVWHWQGYERKGSGKYGLNWWMKGTEFIFSVVRDSWVMVVVVKRCKAPSRTRNVLDFFFYIYCQLLVDVVRLRLGWREKSALIFDMLPEYLRRGDGGQSCCCCLLAYIE